MNDENQSVRNSCEKATAAGKNVLNAVRRTIAKIVRFARSEKVRSFAAAVEEKLVKVTVPLRKRLPESIRDHRATPWAIAAVPVVLLAFLLRGCGGCSEPKPTIRLAPNVSLEMVRLPNGTWFGKYEVTQAQWEAVMGANPSTFKGPDNPVECVSWYDSQQFIGKLNAMPVVRKSGLSFRLPTEGEWNVACQAGAKGGICRLADGQEIDRATFGRVSWFDENAGKKSHPVGQKEPNAFGLYDMLGNVWEWTSTEDVENGESRIFNGGSWENTAYFSIVFRVGNRPDYHASNLGFRLCASVRAD